MQAPAPFRWGKSTAPRAKVTAAPEGQAMWRYCLPVPNRVLSWDDLEGRWWHRRWFWWGVLGRRLRCAITRHKWVARDYPETANGPFTALECDHCATRAGIVEP